MKVREMKVPIMANTIQFPALKYKSGEREWLVITVQYKALGKFITTSTVKRKNQEIIKGDLLNRFLDSKHKNEIKKYIEEEKKYTIPPITLVSFEKLNFQPIVANDEDSLLTEYELLEKYGSIAGVTFLPIDYELICLDGNHRVVAIRELANENPELIQGSSMVLNIVYEEDKMKIRQDFVDVNKNAKATTPSINTLFNTRDPLTRMISEILEKFEYLKETTELLANSVSKVAKNIYTINNIKNVVIELAGYSSGTTANATKVSRRLKEDKEFAVQLKEEVEDFFKRLKENYYIAMCIENYDDIPRIREKSIITSGAGIVVCSKAFSKVIKTVEADELRENVLNEIMHFDWGRKNLFFKGTLVNENGGITPGQSVFNEVANKIYRELVKKI